MKITTTKRPIKFNEAFLHAYVSQRVKATFAKDEVNKPEPIKTEPMDTLKRLDIARSKFKLKRMIKAKPSTSQILFKAMDAQKERKVATARNTTRDRTREVFKDFDFDLKNNQKKSMR